MMDPVHHMMDRGIHHMIDRVQSYPSYDGRGTSYDGYLFSTNLLYLWFSIAYELKNLNSKSAVKLFF